jgi:phosphoribosylformylglycinamidine synthase
MTAMVSEAYASMGLTKFEYDLILKLLGRDPTMTELGMFAVMWSEHCGYKYSRPILRYFSKYREAMEGEGLENAGIVPIGDNLGVVMKVESHNHPSAVEPYQGAATGVGGIIRDIFTMGARPIAALNSLRFGPIRDGEADDAIVKRNRRLFEGVVAGIAGYGNCVGVPTVAGEVSFHPRFSGNPLVNAMCVGLVELDQVATAGAAGIGNPVLYLGSATGKDGIHGATFASDALGEDNEDKRPNVQIGDPFAEKVLIEATLEALRTGAIVAIQDMGAAGLTCSTIEMSAKGGVGMDVDLDLVPMREQDMSAYELMLSESQERMLAVAHLSREQEVIDVFEKWGAHAVVIGYVNDTGNVRVTRHGEEFANVPAPLLADQCPSYTLEFDEPQYFRDAKAFDPSNLPPKCLEEGLMRLLSAPTLAGKRWVFQQYDQQVQTQTTLRPDNGDAAVLAPRGTKKGLALKIDGNGRWTYFDPYAGGCLAVVEAARNVACTGGRPTAATDGLNFGNPQNPRVYWQFERAVKGIADAAEALETPVVSGNVSFYNESDLGEILPTPMIGMLGILEDATKRIGMAFPNQACRIALVRYAHEEVPQQGIGASDFLAEVHGTENGVPIRPNLLRERDLCRWLADAIHEGQILAAHDVSEGGSLFALAEMAASGEAGCAVKLDGRSYDFTERADFAAFAELPGYVFICVADGVEPTLPAGLEMEYVGVVTPDKSDFDVVVKDQSINVSVERLRERRESVIPGLMGSVKS